MRGRGPAFPDHPGASTSGRRSRAPEEGGAASATSFGCRSQEYSRRSGGGGGKGAQRFVAQPPTEVEPCGNSKSARGEGGEGRGNFRPRRSVLRSAFYLGGIPRPSRLQVSLFRRGPPATVSHLVSATGTIQRPTPEAHRGRTRPPGRRRGRCGRERNRRGIAVSTQRRAVGYRKRGDDRRLLLPRRGASTFFSRRV